MTLPRAQYYFDRDHRFVVDNYNWAKPFSNFFPGIAGKWGIPMWIYYVSKAQAVCSLGVHDKDHAILEFLSFNKACQTVGKEGFRTFVKLDGASVYEPFQKVGYGHIPAPGRGTARPGRKRLPFLSPLSLPYGSLSDRAPAPLPYKWPRSRGRLLPL